MFTGNPRGEGFDADVASPGLHSTLGRRYADPLQPHDGDGFRHSEIRDAYNALLDIQLAGRSKELLAQGLLPQVWQKLIISH